jgi:hypothetical protein
MPRKIPFLPLFFIGLGLIFATAVFIRVRSYQTSATTTLNGAAAEIAPTAPDVIPEVHPSVTQTEYELVQVMPDGSPMPGATTSTSAASVRTGGMTPREQRYNELLRSAPPPGPKQQAATSAPTAAAPAPVAAAPKTEPSLIRRAANAVANALGGRDAQQQVQRPQQQQQPPQQQTEKPKPTEPPDPDSDVTPPQLVTLEFQPPQIRDGETTTLLVQVVDDLSGVASVSGVISSPTNAVQGFAAQREADTGRYIARITVPPEAAEGIWKINYLTLSDNARNSVNLTAAAGMLPPTSTFRVTSNAPDSAGPQLKSIWIDRPAMRAGERNTIFVQADDDKAGVASVNGVLLSPSKTARLGFNCRLNGAQWECAITPPSCLDCGIWSIEQIQLEDKARNMTSFRADNPMVKQAHIDITGEQCDSQPPTMSAVTLSQQVVSNTEANTIIARAMVQDDVCGVMSVSGQAVGPGGTNPPRLYFSFDRQGELWVANISVPKHAAKGTWTISWVQTLDKGNNLKAYSERDPALAGVVFQVR